MKKSHLVLVALAVILPCVCGGCDGSPFDRLDQAEHEANILRTREKLSQIHTQLFTYEISNGRLPSRGGPDFLLSVLKSEDGEKKGHMEKTKDSCMVFFDAFTGNLPGRNLENVTAEGIDFTGRNQEDRAYLVRRITERNASEKIIAAQKLGPDGAAPCDGEGICVLFLDGRTKFIPASEFKNSEVVIGPESSIEALHGLVPFERN